MKLFNFDNDSSKDIVIRFFKFSISSKSYDFFGINNTGETISKVLSLNAVDSVIVDDFDVDSDDEFIVNWCNSSYTEVQIYNQSFEIVEKYNYSTGDYVLRELVWLKDGYYKKFLFYRDSISSFLLKRKSNVNFTFSIQDPQISGLYVCSNNSLNTTWTLVIDSGNFLNLSAILNGTILATNLLGNSSHIFTFSSEAIYLIELEIEFEDFGTDKLYFYAIYDITKPCILELWPSNNSYFNNTIIDFKWNTSDNIEVSSVELVVDNVTQYTYYSENGTIQLNLSEGVHTINITIYDLANNFEKSLVKIFVDLTPPSIDIVNPNKTLVYTNKSILLEWVASDNFVNGIQKYVVYLNQTEYFNTSNQNNVLVNFTQPGFYNVRVYAFDKAGNSAFDEINIIVDFEAPSLVILQPLNNSYTNNATVEIEWNVSDANYEKVLVTLPNGTTIEIIDDNEIEANIVEGDNVFILRAYDKAGNKNETIVRIILDIKVPQLNILEPKNGTIYNTLNITIMWDSSDNCGIAEEKVFINTTEVSLGSGTNYMLTSDGKYNLTILVIDLAGNVNVSKVFFEVDTTPPLVSIISPQNNSKQSSDLIVRWSISEKNFLYAKLIINGSQFAVFYEDNYTDEFQVEWLTEGNISIIVVATDVVNNSNSCKIHVYVDLSPIEFSVSEPENNSYVNKLNILLEISFDDVSDFYSMEVRVNSTLYNVYNTPVTILNITLIGEGFNLITLNVSDDVGNFKCVMVGLYADLTPPSLSIDYKEYVNVSSTTVRLDFSDNYGLYELVIYRNGFLYNAYAPVPEVIELDLLEGNNTFVFKLMDLANNSESVSVWIYYDNAKPTIIVNEPLNGTYTNKFYMKFNVSLYDLETGVEATVVYVNDHEVTVDDFSNFSIFLDIEGENFVKIYAVDKAGNVEVVSIIIIRDTVEPVINVLSPENLSYINGSVEVELRIVDENPSFIRLISDDTFLEENLTSENFSTTIYSNREGYLIVLIEVFDRANNSASVIIKVYNDLTQPKINCLVDRDTVYVGDSIKLNISVTDNSGVDKIIIFIDQVKYGEYGKNELSLNITLQSVGTHIIKVYAIDKAGNIASAIIMVEVKEKPKSEPLSFDITMGILGIFGGLIVGFLYYIYYSWKRERK